MTENQTETVWRDNRDLAGAAPVAVPGLEPETARPGIGYVEREMRTQIQRMAASGEVDDRHAGLIALAMVAARNVDTMGFEGRPSGRANMLRAAREVFEMLPEVQAVDTDGFQEIVAALREPEG